MLVLTIFGWLTDLVSGEWWTYLLVFGVALADAVLPLVPSETIVILAGIAAAAGGLEIWLVIALGGIVYWRIAERSEAR
jgi:membrane protein DedA with SNARE-associated domain